MDHKGNLYRHFFNHRKQKPIKLTYDRNLAAFAKLGIDPAHQDIFGTDMVIDIHEDRYLEKATGEMNLDQEVMAHRKLRGAWNFDGRMVHNLFLSMYLETGENKEFKGCGPQGFITMVHVAWIRA